jgi:hypothetical protein
LLLGGGGHLLGALLQARGHLHTRLAGFSHARFLAQEERGALQSGKNVGDSRGLDQEVEGAPANRFVGGGALVLPGQYDHLGRRCARQTLVQHRKAFAHRARRRRQAEIKQDQIRRRCGCYHRHRRRAVAGRRDFVAPVAKR